MVEQRIEEVRIQFNETLDTYLKLIEESDKLAIMMEVEELDQVLCKFLPIAAKERRSTVKAENWFSASITELRERLEDRTTKENREALIKSLNLTDEQRALLFSA